MKIEVFTYFFPLLSEPLQKPTPSISSPCSHNISAIAKVILGTLFFPAGIYWLCQPLPIRTFQVQPSASKWDLLEQKAQAGLAALLLKRPNSVEFDFVKITLLFITLVSFRHFLSSYNRYASCRDGLAFQLERVMALKKQIEGN